MQEFTYESIRPLLVEAQQDGHYLSCIFRCPLSNFSIESRAVLQHASIGEDFIGSAQKRATGSAKSSLVGFLRRIFGGATLGAAADTARGAIRDNDQPDVYSEEATRRAVLEAFHEVLTSFVWDGGAERWISAQAGADLLPEFNQQLAAAPVSDEQDREVLARILVEIAQADGTFATEERAFLESFLGADEGRVDQLAEHPPLSSDELAGCGALPIRETMLMLAWATSLVDGDLHAKEAERIEDFAHMLSVRAARAAELKRYAQIYLVDQALEHAYEEGPGGARRHAEAFALAERLGLDHASIERCDVRLRKRLGRT